MGTASQLVIVDGSPESSSYSVSYSHYNSLRYFVAASAISAVCSAAALYLFAVCADAAGRLAATGVHHSVLDAVAQGFLFSAAGAALAARDVLGGPAGPSGSSAGGGRVCDVAGTFCGRVTVAAAVCAFAAVSATVAALTRDAGDGSSGRWRSD